MIKTTIEGYYYFREYPKVCVNLQTDIDEVSVW